MMISALAVLGGVLVYLTIAFALFIAMDMYLGGGMFRWFGEAREYGVKWAPGCCVLLWPITVPILLVVIIIIRTTEPRDD